MKIHIIGCSGTGKTCLARDLSEKYNIPHFDLDDLQWDSTADEYGARMPVEKRNALFQHILAKDSWIIEGIITYIPLMAKYFGVIKKLCWKPDKIESHR